MPTIAETLKYANLQMAAEALNGFEVNISDAPYLAGADDRLPALASAGSAATEATRSQTSPGGFIANDKFWSMAA